MTGEPEFTAIVDRRVEVADGVVELVLRPQTAVEWQPGAHVDLLLPDGLVRQYSLCGDPDDLTLKLAVLREPDGRGGSVWVHDRLRLGDEVRLRGPRNNFTLLDVKRYIFVAGGIGITPLLPMVRKVNWAGAQWRLVYGGRSRAAMAYRDEVVALGGELRPQDEHGLLDLEEIIGAPDPEAVIYCCGPGPLLDAVQERCATGWPPGSLQVERFAPKKIAAGADFAFEVECALSGQVVPVPAGRSILHAVEAAGITVLSSCQEGTCGTCETAVLDGEPEHRDSVLTPEEQATNDIMMICCSRSRSSRLVLEL
jgi:ferredoxin-NADP reductase